MEAGAYVFSPSSKNKKFSQAFRDWSTLDFIAVTLMIFHFQINSQMLRSLVFTGVNPMNSIESEEFGTNMTAGVINYQERNNWKFMVNGGTTSMHVFGFPLV